MDRGEDVSSLFPPFDYVFIADCIYYQQVYLMGYVEFIMHIPTPPLQPVGHFRDTDTLIAFCMISQLSH